MRSRFAVAIVVLWMLPRVAFAAFTVPAREGALTDATHRITDDDKRDLAAMLDQIEADTKVELAVFVADVPSDRLVEAGRAAYDQWKLGEGWVSGVLLAISADGRGCRVILPSANPPLARDLVGDIERSALALAQDGRFGAAIRAAVEPIGRILRQSGPVALPRGERDVARAEAYAVFALLVLAFAIAATVRRELARRRGARATHTPLSRRIDEVLLGLVVVGAGLRIPRLAQPDGALIFDEAYYVQDARVILGIPVRSDHLPPDAMAGLDPNAEHPPLAKLVMAGSMACFGADAVGWRIPSVALGLLAILLVYGIVLRAGGSRDQARVAAFLMTFENLVMIHGRIATLDIYVLTFMLLGAWLYLSRRWELAGVAFGLATLCKLNGLLGVGAIGLFELARVFRADREIRKAALVSLARMVGVYVAFTVLALGALDCAFTAFRNPFAHLEHMVRYGSALKRTGGIAGEESTPLMWWVNESMMTYLKVQQSTGDLTRTVIFFRGALTPLVVFAAPFAFVWAGIAAWRRTSDLALLSLAWLVANYVPLLLAWAFASRVSYIYYFLQSQPAMILAIAFGFPSLPRSMRWCFIGAVLWSVVWWYPFRWH